MTVRLATLASFLSIACSSTAPHTLGAAAINTALATGAAAGARAEGGCYAVCTGGTACNRHTGLCERRSPEVWVDAAVRDDKRLTLQLQERSAAATPPPSVLGVGVSPATGSVPPPPAESSPRPEPR